ncbi:hypothetical protein ANO11243_028160 [Dothideomycetidae sp. 11243]|nr:hypothetical protein ANO11243_028160 [fungal sp. No.11243]
MAASVRCALLRSGTRCAGETAPAGAVESPDAEGMRLKIGNTARCYFRHVRAKLPSHVNLRIGAAASSIAASPSSLIDLTRRRSQQQNAPSMRALKRAIWREHIA